jgi:hypothetical protein
LAKLATFAVSKKNVRFQCAKSAGAGRMQMQQASFATCTV